MIGIIMVFTGIYLLDLKIFAASLVILESGHIYNHVRKIKSYDFRLKTIFWRITSFILLVIIFYIITLFLR